MHRWIALEQWREFIKVCQLPGSRPFLTQLLHHPFEQRYCPAPVKYTLGRSIIDGVLHVAFVGLYRIDGHESESSSALQGMRFIPLVREEMLDRGKQKRTKTAPFP